MLGTSLRYLLKACRDGMYEWQSRRCYSGTEHEQSPLQVDETKGKCERRLDRIAEASKKM
jgi:hypothetical protein